MRMHGKAVAVLAFVCAYGIASAAPSGTPALAASLESQAKIGMAEARQIALKAYPGTIEKEELELERGGSGLRYSFDLRRGGQWREIGVDAKTGRILENAPEQPNPQD